MEYPPRIYEFSLQTVELVVGIILLVVHLIGLLRPQQCTDWLVKFPRSRTLGISLLLVDALWAFWLVSSIDLGEFSGARTYLQLGVPVAFVLTVIFLAEFLAVRALGMFALLAGEPMLSAAFLRPELSRFFLVVFAYVWLTLGLFWVGMPYLLRDQITWVTKTVERFRTAAVAGMVYGLAIVVSAFTVH
jgi:hypothetical protein